MKFCHIFAFIGMKGSTKGRLFPTLNMSLYSDFPSGIVSVSAGANFTAAVTTTGLVFRYCISPATLLFLYLY